MSASPAGSRLDRAFKLVERVVAELEPECLTGPDAERLVRVFAHGKRLCEAGLALAARRVQECGAFKRSGHRSAADFLASTCGESLQSAQQTLGVAAAVTKLDDVDEALRSGRLSLVQAAAVTAAASADPSQGKALLRAASRVSLAELKAQAVAVKSAVASEMSKRALYAAIHQGRFCRTFTDGQGAFRLSARLTADAGARVAACLQAERNAVFEAARKAGITEPHDAYSADAFYNLMTGVVAGAVALGKASRRAGVSRSLPSASPGSRNTQVPPTICVRVDAAALQRGFTESGELCDIAGVGPVPVTTVSSMLCDSWVKILVTDGVDIKTVCHVGRTIPSHLRTALEFRDPTCVVPGCRTSQGLQIDHDIDFSRSGPTSLDNLRRLCKYHHHLKTVYNYNVVGGPGNWKWVEPPDSQRRPPMLA